MRRDERVRALGAQVDRALEDAVDQAQLETPRNAGKGLPAARGAKLREEVRQ